MELTTVYSAVMEERTDNIAAAEVSLLAVIVLYRIEPCTSSSLITLMAAAERAADPRFKLAILIQDNTPGGQVAGNLPECIRYKSEPSNPGLAQAYNSALKVAKAEGYDWLLTLDQDTTLPPDFLARIARIIAEQSANANVGAIVPRVVGDDRVLSPFMLFAEAVPQWYEGEFRGVAPCTTYAVNSASTLRVSALERIGGYDPDFPLDASDLAMFHRLGKNGMKVYIAGEVVVHHQLALLRKHKRMSLERYRAGMLDECAFWDMNLGPLARLERLVRLTGRFCKDLSNPAAAAYQSLTLAEIKRRLLTSRSKRISQWKDRCVEKKVSA